MVSSPKRQGSVDPTLECLDDRLTWPERELVRQLGERLYGKREPEVRYD